MTEAAAGGKNKIQISTEEGGGCVVTIGNARVAVSSDGKTFTAYTNDGVETKAAVSSAASLAARIEAAAAGTTNISISRDFNKVVLNGVTIEQAADGHLVITAPGVIVVHKPAPANDAPTTIGTKMTDGSVFAGLTADGKQQIYAMPTDLDVTLTFNDAAKWVTKLNADKSFGHDDWQIPSLENLCVLQKNQNEGALKGTFNTSNKGSASGYPVWYWSSTENRDDSSSVHNVRFSDGYEGWGHKDHGRLSCRLVRFVACKTPQTALHPAL